jgi:hypothetical protein
VTFQGIATGKIFLPFIDGGFRTISPKPGAGFYWVMHIIFVL